MSDLLKTIQTKLEEAYTDYLTYQKIKELYDIIVNQLQKDIIPTFTNYDSIPLPEENNVTSYQDYITKKVDFLTTIIAYINALIGNINLLIDKVNKVNANKEFNLQTLKTLSEKANKIKNDLVNYINSLTISSQINPTDLESFTKNINDIKEEKENFPDVNTLLGGTGKSKRRTNKKH